MTHSQPHKQHRVGWLRASVLGANDGIISISSLIIGVVSAGSSSAIVLITAIAGVIAGAISMAAGEYVSVCTQHDTEQSDLLLEARSLEKDYESEKTELAKIYEQRGVDPNTAVLVATQMMEFDALASHARDDIGISEQVSAQPLLAAFSSALSFTAGAILPLLVILFVPTDFLLVSVAASTLVCLTLLGALSSYLSGTKLHVGIFRVTFWGIFAMAATALVGFTFDVSFA